MHKLNGHPVETNVLRRLEIPSVRFTFSDGIPKGGKILGRLERRVKAHVVDGMGLFLKAEKKA